MSPSADVLIYVQHLLGIGHLKRAATLARAFARMGLSQVFVSGGPPVAGLDVGSARFLQLPPIQAGDELFTHLVDLDGRRVGDDLKAARRDQLLDLLDECRPKVLLTEMFPFGRRALRFELLPLIEAARARRPAPLIVSSVRDILTYPMAREKESWILDTANRLFDLIMVHGDPDFIRLDRTFPRAGELGCRVVYTGYVVPEPLDLPHCQGEAGLEVLVSAGGGAVGRPLLASAMEARGLSVLRDLPWRLLTGPNLSREALHEIATRAPEGVTVERSSRDFRALLASARLSVSQAGYNTLVEVLQAGVPAVVVPYADGRETEQAVRAEALAERGLVGVVRAEELTATSLAAAIDRAAEAAGSSVRTPKLDTAGATHSARLIADLVGSQAP